YRIGDKLLSVCLGRFEALTWNSVALPQNHSEETMRIAHGGILSLLLAVALMAGSSSAQLADKKTLTLAIAKQIAAAAEAEAIKNKFTMVISVLDDGGNL